MAPGAKGRRLRYLDDFCGNLGCTSPSLAFVVQKGAKGRRLRYLDDFFKNLECKSVSLGFLVQKLDRLDTYTTSSGTLGVNRSLLGSWCKRSTFLMPE